MTKKLTRRQAGIYRYIVNYIEANNYPPTVREIADEFEIKSTNGVSEHIKALVRKGLLAKDSSKSRALRPLMTMEELGIDASELEGNDAFRRRACVSSNLDKKRPSKHKEPACERLDSARVKEIPLLGQIAAGTPILAEQNIDDQILVDANLFGRGQDRLYALRVRGTSMIGDGIMPGDMVFVRPQATAENGELIAAMVDGSATVKRYEKRNGMIYLIPSNPTMDPIVVDPSNEEFSIIGAIRGVLRQYS
ncbi:MAG: transcriptional repressor LexA [Proteobacteria bacterium]|nr:transcriptional repressor LexA [Pseudomonadota bacterium]